MAEVITYGIGGKNKCNVKCVIWNFISNSHFTSCFSKQEINLVLCSTNDKRQHFHWWSGGVWPIAVIAQLYTTVVYNGAVIQSTMVPLIISGDTTLFLRKAEYTVMTGNNFDYKYQEYSESTTCRHRISHSHSKISDQSTQLRSGGPLRSAGTQTHVFREILKGIRIPDNCPFPSYTARSAVNTAKSTRPVLTNPG